MLQSLHVKNYIFPGAISLELNQNMTVITGETGAGKSLLIEALAVLIGKKTISDSALTEQPLSIQGHFDIRGQDAVRTWLETHHLLKDDSRCEIRCTAKKKARAQFKVNGQTLSRHELKELGELLVDIVGQNTHQYLANSKNHLHILDDYCQHQAATRQLAVRWKNWKQVLEKIQTLKKQQTEKESRMELLRYHVNELDSLSPQEGEYETLDSTQRRFSQIEEATQQIQLACNHLYQREDDSLYAQVAQVITQLNTVSKNDAAIAAIQSQLETVLTLIQEANSSLSKLLERPAMEKEEFATLEKRLSDYIELARKHQVPPAELAQHHTRLSKELRQLENPQQDFDQLEQQAEKHRAQYHQLAQKISRQRQKKSTQLMQEVTQQLQTLNMPAARFLVTLTSDAAQAGSNGIDRVEFIIQTNAEQLPLPIGKIASGGELSRIHLAIQAKISENQLSGTLVFDEVDTGIGGKTAERVGALLKELSDKTQVLCITHLSQIAKFAQTHFSIDKKIKPKTHILVQCLSGAERDQEIARMLSGEKITQRTLAHAREILTAEQEEKHR